MSLLSHGKLVAGLTATTLAAAFLVRRSYALSSSMPKYTLHVYDHCPFCIRVELLCGIFGINYDRVVYGYGEGAPAEKHGYGDGPVKLTGKKMLPVLEGPGVPKPSNMGNASNSVAPIRAEWKFMFPQTVWRYSW